MNKKYTIELTTKSYFNYCLYELKLELIFLSALIFLGFGGYATWITLDYFAGEDLSRAMLNILVNVLIILAAIAVLVGAVILISWFVAKSKVNEPQSKKLSFDEETFSLASDAVNMTVRYDAVKDFTELKHLLVLTIPGVNTILVPKESIPESELIEVIEFLKEKTAQAQAFSDLTADEKAEGNCESDNSGEKDAAADPGELFDEQSEDN